MLLAKILIYFSDDLMDFFVFIFSDNCAEYILMKKIIASSV